MLKFTPLEFENEEEKQEIVKKVLVKFYSLFSLKFTPFLENFLKGRNANSSGQNPILLAEPFYPKVQIFLLGF